MRPGYFFLTIDQSSNVDWLTVEGAWVVLSNRQQFTARTVYCYTHIQYPR